MPTRYSIPKQILGLLIWLALAYATAAVGAMASIDARDFYASLDRPTWAPPGWLFGPVWTALYSLMGLSAWLVWREHGAAGRIRALTVFGTQLVLNAAWSWIFFVWRQGFFALLEVILLLALIAATMVTFRRITRLAAALLIPYFAWVSFAAALTASLWTRNPGLLH